MVGKRFGWPLRGSAEPKAPPTPPPPVPANATPVVAPPAPQQRAHHWVSVVVAREGPVGLVPVPGARVLVRPFEKGQPRPGDPVGRGASRADGTIAFLLPEGRYAITASIDGEFRAVTMRVEHAGRATLMLQRALRRIVLDVEAEDEHGDSLVRSGVEIHAVSGGVVARGTTNDAGIARFELPAGAYEVRVGSKRAKTFIEVDTRVRVRGTAAAPGVTGTEATSSLAVSFDASDLDDNVWN